MLWRRAVCNSNCMQPLIKLRYLLEPVGRVVPLIHRPDTLMMLSHMVKFSLHMNDTYIKVFEEQLQTAKHIPYVEMNK